MGLKWMQWIGLLATFGKTCETEEYLRSINILFLFYFTNQDCILITQSNNFSKILCNPKLRQHFRMKCICQLTLIFVFENVA